MRHYLLFELNRLRREPRFAFLTIIMPAGLYLMISSIGMAAGSAAEGEIKNTSLIGMACYGVLMVTITNGVNISLDRGLGWISQLRTTPIRAWQVIIGKMLSGTALAIPSLVCIFLVGGLTQNIHLSAVQWIEAGAIVWVGSLPFALLGFGLGYLTSPTTGGPTVMGTVLGLSVIGGLWVPAAIFPSVVQQISSVLPTNRWERLGMSVLGSGGTSAPMIDLLVLAGWTAVFGALAVFAYRRGALR